MEGELCYEAFMLLGCPFGCFSVSVSVLVGGELCSEIRSLYALQGVVPGEELFYSGR